MRSPTCAAHRQIEMCRFNDVQRAETKLFTHTPYTVYGIGILNILATGIMFMLYYKYVCFFTVYV